MQRQNVQYSRQMIPTFLSGVSHDDLKWTVNYIIKLLSIPEVRQDESDITLDEAMSYLDSISLKSHNVPGDFNGMRNEPNEKYL